MGEALRTKCIVTLGPASWAPETLEALVKAGVWMFRFNMAHTFYEDYARVYRMLRDLNARLGTDAMMQADLQGPHIRIGRVADEGVFVQQGQTYVFCTLAGEPQPYDIPINDATIQNYVRPGQPIIFLNGLVEGEIVQVEKHRIWVRMASSGTLKTNKSINLPQTRLDSCLTEKDRADLAFLLKEGVDYLALSFVSRPEDVREVRGLLGGASAKVMSKIERQAALENLDGIIAESDAVMIARGDLGVEIPFQDVPFVQKDVIAACRKQEKPVVVATQLLYSLTRSLRPTRAEVADVAEAVCEGADALLLSDETAEGIDPLNAVNTMLAVVKRSEQYLEEQKR